MILDEFSYIIQPEMTGRIEEDVSRLLTANGRVKTEAHVRNVAHEAGRIARMYGLDEEICMAAGFLHDVSAVIRPDDMLRLAMRRGMTLCEAERRYPFLLHQRMSRLAAREAFGVTDERVLSAVECHTTLKEHASPEDMTLFLADKLAWDQEGEPPFAEEVMSALSRSLKKACLVYMEYMNKQGKVLCPHEHWIQALEWMRT